MSRGTELVRLIFPPEGRDLVEDARLSRAATRDALGSLLHPDLEVEWHPGGDLPMPSALSGVARGFDAYWDRYQDYLESMESFRITPEDPVELEDGRIMIPSRIEARTKHAGVAIEMMGGAIWSLEDGLIRRIDEYLDRAELHEAAGVAPPGD